MTSPDKHRASGSLSGFGRGALLGTASLILLFLTGGALADVRSAPDTTTKVIAGGCLLALGALGAVGFRALRPLPSEERSRGLLAWVLLSLPGACLGFGSVALATLFSKG